MLPWNDMGHDDKLLNYWYHSKICKTTEKKKKYSIAHWENRSNLEEISVSFFVSYFFTGKPRDLDLFKVFFDEEIFMEI